MFPAIRLSDVHKVRTTVDALARALRPGEVPAGDAAEMWEAFAAIERQASAAKTLLAARVADVHTGQGTPEEHLARKAGTSRRAARRAITTSRHLRSLPGTEAALRRGELSPQQAETVVDAATVNPAAESSLLDTARTGTLKQLRDDALRAKAAADPDPDATHERIHRGRFVRRWTDPDGAWCLRGPAEAGAVLNAVLEPLIDEVFRTARRDDRRESLEAYSFDALLALASGATVTTVPMAPGTEPAARAGDPSPATPDAPAHDPAPADRRGQGRPAGDCGLAGSTTNGGPTPADPAAPPRRSTDNPRFLALLRVDLAAIARGRTEGDELCEIAGIGPVPARTARTLLGDAVLKLVITRGVDVANVTSLGRGPTAAQRIALLWATPGCTNSECDNTLAIQHDHRVPWADDQVTELHNLDRLCPNPCHARKTHDGWALIAGTGRRPLVRPHGPRHPANTNTANHSDPPPATATDLPHAARDATLLDNNAA